MKLDKINRFSAYFPAKLYSLAVGTTNGVKEDALRAEQLPQNAAEISHTRRLARRFFGDESDRCPEYSRCVACALCRDERDCLSGDIFRKKKAE
jgi:hypothetical protein